MREQLRLVKSLADETRLRILKLIENEQHCVCELQEVLGIVQSAVSRHLKILDDAGIVSKRRSGIWTDFFVDLSLLDPEASRIVTAVLSSLEGDPGVIEDRRRISKVRREEVCGTRRVRAAAI
jgi:ArsR family transcriptional regulator